MCIWSLGSVTTKSDGKESPWNTGDPGSIPGLGRSPGEGNVNSLQYSCLGNPLGRGAWQATVHGIQKSQMLLSDERTAPMSIYVNSSLPVHATPSNSSNILSHRAIHYWAILGYCDSPAVS